MMGVGGEGSGKLFIFRFLGGNDGWVQEGRCLLHKCVYFVKIELYPHLTCTFLYVCSLIL